MHFDDCWCILFLGRDVAGFGFLGWWIGRLWGGGEGWGVAEKGKTKKKVRLYLVAVVAVENNRNYFRKKVVDVQRRCGILTNA